MKYGTLVFDWDGTLIDSIGTVVQCIQDAARDMDVFGFTDAVDAWQKAVDDAQAAGGRIVLGGNRITEGDFAHGYYVQPTVVDELTPDHRVFHEELFVPFVSVQETESIEESMRLANDVFNTRAWRRCYRWRS